MTMLLWFLAFVTSQTGSAVSGQVTDVATRAPVVEALVLLARADGALSHSLVARTDEQGRFTIAAVPPGTYRVFAIDADYLRTEFNHPITVVAGQPVANVGIAMTRAAVIEGRVMNEHGEPAPNIFVRAWTSIGQVAETRTNDLGEYRLFGLEPASYTISAERYLSPRIDGTFYVGPTAPCPDCMG